MNDILLGDDGLEYELVPYSPQPSSGVADLIREEKQNARMRSERLSVELAQISAAMQEPPPQRNTAKDAWGAALIGGLPALAGLAMGGADGLALAADPVSTFLPGYLNDIAQERERSRRLFDSRNSQLLKRSEDLQKEQRRGEQRAQERVVNLESAELNRKAQERAAIAGRDVNYEREIEREERQRDYKQEQRVEDIKRKGNVGTGGRSKSVSSSGDVFLENPPESFESLEISQKERDEAVKDFKNFKEMRTLSDGYKRALRAWKSGTGEGSQVASAYFRMLNTLRTSGGFGATFTESEQGLVTALLPQTVARYELEYGAVPTIKALQDFVVTDGGNLDAMIAEADRFDAFLYEEYNSKAQGNPLYARMIPREFSLEAMNSKGVQQEDAEELQALLMEQMSRKGYLSAVRLLGEYFK